MSLFSLSFYQDAPKPNSLLIQCIAETLLGNRIKYVPGERFYILRSLKKWNCLGTLYSVFKRNMSYI